MTVASETRSVDLAVPAALPLAELLPELARAVGLLDASRVHGGYRVVTPDGRRLEDDAGLAAQGVEDGCVLTVAAGVDDELVRRYDDPAEATADVLAELVPPWPSGAGRRAALGAAALLLGLALVAQVLGPVAPATRGGPVDVTAATAVVLLGGAAALSRGWAASDAAAVLAWAAVAHAALAGARAALAAEGRPGGVTAAAGAGALAASVAAVAGLAHGRVVLLPAAWLGALALAVGSLTVRASVDPRLAAGGLLVAAAFVGALSPRLAVGAARVGAAVRAPGAAPIEASGPPEAEILADEMAGPGVPQVDLAAVEADALLAHRVVVALEVTLGLLLVLLAPLVVTLGPAGAALGLCCCAIVGLRARRFRAAAPVLVCLGGGAVATAATVATVLLSHPDARAPLAGVLVVASLVLCVTLPCGGAGWHRAAGLAESCCLVALLPLVVTAAGVLGRVQAVLGSVAG